MVSGKVKSYFSGLCGNHPKLSFQNLTSPLLQPPTLSPYPPPLSPSPLCLPQKDIIDFLTSILSPQEWAVLQETMVSLRVREEQEELQRRKQAEQDAGGTTGAEGGSETLPLIQTRDRQGSFHLLPSIDCVDLNAVASKLENLLANLGEEAFKRHDPYCEEDSAAVSVGNHVEHQHKPDPVHAPRDVPKYYETELGNDPLLPNTFDLSDINSQLSSPSGICLLKQPEERRQRSNTRVSDPDLNLVGISRALPSASAHTNGGGNLKLESAAPSPSDDGSERRGSFSKNRGSLQKRTASTLSVSTLSTTSS